MDREKRKGRSCGGVQMKKGCSEELKIDAGIVADRRKGQGAKLRCL